MQRQFPEAKISLAIASHSRELLPAIPGIARIFVAKGKLTETAEWLTLGRRKYRYCIDFSPSDRSAFITLLSRAKQRITYANPRRSAVRSLSYTDRVQASVRELHTIDYQLALLAPLGIHDASPAVALTLPERAVREADELLHNAGVSGNFIVIHPGSARSEKYWQPARWAEVIDRAPLTCVLTGGRSAMEQAHIAEIKARTHNAIDLSGRMDLLCLTAVIRRAQLLATVDSAPMHLAAAMHTPQVIIFGPTNPFHWRPRRAVAAILQGAASEPLTEFSPARSPFPTTAVSTPAVIGAMKTLLSAPAARPS